MVCLSACGSQWVIVLFGVQANQTYRIVLYAADLYWGKPRQRIFSVAANGVTVLKAYDVIASAGGCAILVADHVGQC